MKNDECPRSIRRDKKECVLCWLSADQVDDWLGVDAEDEDGEREQDEHGFGDGGHSDGLGAAWCIPIHRFNHLEVVVEACGD